MDNHIAARLAGDETSSILDGRVHERRETVNFFHSLLGGGFCRADIVQQVCLRRSQSDGHILLCQGVINRGDDLCLGGNSQHTVADCNGVTQGYPLQYSGIFRLLPQRFKGNSQRGCSDSQRVVAQILVGKCPESSLGYRVLLIEILGEVPDEGLTLYQRSFGNGDQYLFQGDNCFCAVFCGDDRIRQKIRIDISIFVVMLQICEVLAVLNDHSRFLSTALVVNNLEVIPLELTAPEIQKGTGHTAETGADTLGLGDRECLYC